MMMIAPRASARSLFGLRFRKTRLTRVLTTRLRNLKTVVTLVTGLGA